MYNCGTLSLYVCVCECNFAYSFTLHTHSHSSFLRFAASLCLQLQPLSVCITITIITIDRPIDGRKKDWENSSFPVLRRRSILCASVKGEGRFGCTLGCASTMRTSLPYPQAQLFAVLFLFWCLPLFFCQFYCCCQSMQHVAALALTLSYLFGYSVVAVFVVVLVARFTWIRFFFFFTRFSKTILPDLLLLLPASHMLNMERNAFTIFIASSFFLLSDRRLVVAATEDNIILQMSNSKAEQLASQRTSDNMHRDNFQAMVWLFGWIVDQC